MSPTNAFDSATARVLNLRRWAREVNPRAATQPARDGFLRRFEAQVPEAITDPEERERRARLLMRAYMIELGRKRHTKGRL